MHLISEQIRKAELRSLLNPGNIERQSLGESYFSTRERKREKEEGKEMRMVYCSPIAKHELVLNTRLNEQFRPVDC